MTEQKPQICIIHGGTVFESDEEYQQALRDLTLNYDRLHYAPSWKNWLAEQLPDRDVLLPSMPNKINAKYDDWALYFSKVVPFLCPDAILIGHSLGGIFLAKYFTENPPAKPFAKLILIAAPYDDETGESLKGFKLSNASTLADAFDEIHLFYSTDDPVVPFTEKNTYLRDLPEAKVHVFEDKQHFNTSTFPELIQLTR
jgi:uncharacterized protein